MVFLFSVKLLFDLNVDSKFIGQKLHGHAYVQADSNDIQLVSAIAVLYPWFGDAVTSIQKYKISSGKWTCREEGTP